MFVESKCTEIALHLHSFHILVFRQVVLMRKKKVEVWPDLVASAATFDNILTKLGVQAYRFVEVLEPSLIPADTKVSPEFTHFTGLHVVMCSLLCRPLLSSSATIPNMVLWSTMTGADKGLACVLSVRDCSLQHAV